MKEALREKSFAWKSNRSKKRLRDALEERKASLECVRVKLRDIGRDEKMKCKGRSKSRDRWNRKESKRIERSRSNTILHIIRKQT